MMNLIRTGYSSMREMIWGSESFSKKGDADEGFKNYIRYKLPKALKESNDPTRRNSLFADDWEQMSAEQKLCLIEAFSKFKTFRGSQGDASATIMRDLACSFKSEASTDQVRRFVDVCWLNNPCAYLKYRREEMSFSGDSEKYAASKEQDAFVKCIETEPDKMTWGPESFPNKGKVDEVFRKYIGYKLAEAVKGNGDPTRMDPLFKRDWWQMSAEQKLYLVEEFSKFKTFRGSQGDAAATIMRDLANSFVEVRNTEFSTDQIRRFIDVCWQNNPCQYLNYRRGEMYFGPDNDIEKYAASKELDAFTKCIENEPSQARNYVNKFPKGTIQKIFSLNRRTELFKESVSFPYCKDEGSEETRKYAKEDAERLAQAWSPDRSIFDPELPFWKRCGLTQADLNEIQKKL